MARRYFFCYEKWFWISRPAGRRERGDEPMRTQWVTKRGEEVAVVEKNEQSVAKVLREPQQGKEKSHLLAEDGKPLDEQCSSLPLTRGKARNQVRHC